MKYTVSLLDNNVGNTVSKAETLALDDTTRALAKDGLVGSNCDSLNTRVVT